MMEITQMREADVPREQLSVTIITLNEERNIRDCLESVRWADETIVVDSGSTDRTIQICLEYTDRIWTNPWPGMNEQKRIAMDHATHPWILNIDADERVSDDLRDHILRVLEARDADGYRFPRKNYFLGRWMKHGGWYPDHVLRLFRKERGRYGGIDPHDKVVVEGKVSTIPAPLVHHTYSSLSQYVSRQNAYSSASAEALVRQGGRIFLLLIPLKTLWKFIETYVVKMGFMDGFHGFVAAMGASFTAFWKYAKLWELTRKKGRTLTLP
jgi:glycosyltransferase involved in cell wall biosynthesis